MALGTKVEAKSDFTSGALGPTFMKLTPKKWTRFFKNKNSSIQKIAKKYFDWDYYRALIKRGLFTWLNQDDWMNMTEIGEHDRKIDKAEQ